MENNTTLKPEAVKFLNSLASTGPRQIRTCERVYSLALALSREGLVALFGRTVLGNGQVRYMVCAS